MTDIDSMIALLERLKAEPYGRACGSELYNQCGPALTRLCDGDTDRARALWHLLFAEFGYMPHAVARALVRASERESLNVDAAALDVEAVL